MKKTWLLLMLAMVVSAAGLAIETEEERKAKQAELDAVCEAARQVKIIAANDTNIVAVGPIELLAITLHLWRPRLRHASVRRLWLSVVTCDES